MSAAPDLHNDPLVSIVTPSYNQAEYIEDTIKSVANQRYDDIEHIVVDGESDDGTIEILQQHDDWLKWISEPDDGQSDAINKGFEMAEGDIVGWLNSDDVLFDVGVLQRVVNYFQQYDAGLIYGDMALLNPRSDVLKLQVVPDFDYEQLLLKCYIEQPSLFFRGDVVANNRLDTDLEYVMDYEFWLRLAQDYTFRHVADVLSGDRNHSQRKILNERDAMQRESEELRGEYGGQTGDRWERQYRLDMLRSGVPRALIAAKRTVSMHSSPPTLSFDGSLRPLPEMLYNLSRPNRTLV